MPSFAFTKNNQSYFWALLAHLLLLWLLLAVKIPLPHQHNSVHKAVQSYLYFRQLQTEISPSKKQIIATTKTTQEDLANKLFKPKKVALKPTQKKLNPIQKKITKKPKQSNANVLSDNTHKDNQPSFSATQALSNFSKRYQQQQLTNEVKNYTQKRGFSVMDIKPEPVPEFTPEIDWQEKERKATTNYGFNNIVKGEDGNCRLDQDLSFARNQGTKVSQYFDCGRTKQQKLYDAHMDKVLKKLGKKR